MKRSHSRGQGMVELALVLPVMLILLMGIWDFGRLVFAQNAVSNGAREGMRLAVVNQNVAAIERKVKSASSGIEGSKVQASFTPCTTPAVGCQASVKVTYAWSPITPIISQIVSSVGLSSTTSMPIEFIHSEAP